jgi:hypothetical protein
MFKVSYWTNLNGSPVKVEFPVPGDPIHWPQNNPNILVKVLGNLPEDTLAYLIELAREMGWGYNPHTQTFYRE